MTTASIGFDFMGSSLVKLRSKHFVRFGLYLLEMKDTLAKESVSEFADHLKLLSTSIEAELPQAMVTTTECLKHNRRTYCAFTRRKICALSGINREKQLAQYH